MCSAELGWTHATLSGTTSVFHPRSWKAFQNPSPELLEWLQQSSVELGVTRFLEKIVSHILIHS